MDLRARDFNGESYYDVSALTADLRFRDSMRLIRQYSRLPFMTPRQFYYPRVVLQFYNTMTSRGVPSPLELRFSIDGRPGVLQATDITAALGLPASLANSAGYKDWPQPSQREMVRCLARDTTAGPILFRRQPAIDAPSGPPVPDQYIPITALCTVQRSYTRGSLQDLRGILV